jgi:uncharacterized protein YjbI with pentapeptide repeats
MVDEAAEPKTSQAPPIADEAKDLKALRIAVVDAAGVSVGLWFSYIFVLLYLLIAVGSVTHRDLFLENPVKLPFLNVDLPLVGFFVLGPLLFLIVHAYVLLHFVLLGSKVGAFHTELESQIPDADARARLRRQLPSNIFVQILAGPREVRSGVIGAMLRLIAQVSLIVAPVALLVFFQIQFLPYHPTWGIELWQRVAVVIDLVLLWMLWPSISRGRVTRISWAALRHGIGVPVGLIRLFWAPLRWAGPPDNKRRITWTRVKLTAIVATAVVASIIPVLLVFTVATVPDEWLDRKLNSTPIIGNLHKLLFAGQADEVTGRPSSWFSNRLVLIDQSFVDLDQLEKKEVSHSFRGRDLTYAVLSRADLRKADFTGAKLNYATLRKTKLERAVFSCAETAGGVGQFGCVELRSADLSYARLQGAHLGFAQLQGANLGFAQLQGADLGFARLQGADLSDAQLQGGDLAASDLRGAHLARAQLQGAHLADAQLRGADLTRAALQGADLASAQLQGAYLLNAQLQGADLADAQLQGADLASAQLQLADLADAELQGADLATAALQGADLASAQLQGADLSDAELQGTGFGKARVWRVNGGERTSHSVIASLPHLGLTDFQGCDPDTKPWSDRGEGPRSFAEWRDLILKEIPIGDVRDAAKKRLSVLDPMQKTTRTVVSRGFWLWKAEPSKDEKAGEKLTTVLGDLACSGPDIALGLLAKIMSSQIVFRNGRTSFTASEVTTIAERLRKGKSDPTACPGVNGFTNQDWSRLDELVQTASEQESEKTKPASKPKSTAQ